MLGLSHPDELVGHRILEFAHPDCRADWHHLQERWWRHKTPHFSLETCPIRADGSSFWCQVTSVPFPDKRTELGYTVSNCSIRATTMRVALRKATPPGINALWLFSSHLLFH